jgi:predicted enzyme involved in methoxymalonyl-ACP biosynthesis
MLTNVICFFQAEKRAVPHLISWKQAFRRLNEEFEMANKKKHALDSLLSSGKISQPTYDAFSKEIEDSIADTEKERNLLLEKMECKAEELREQVKTLEMLITNFEIQHVVGEVDDEVYHRQTELFSRGLDSAREELDKIKDAVSQLSRGNIPIVSETKPQSETIEAVVGMASDISEEKLPKTVAEFAETKDSGDSPQETECAEEAQAIETEKKQET